MIERVADLSGRTGDGIVHVPDTATSLVFRATAAGRADIRVVGPRTRAGYHVGKDLPVCVTIRLLPGAARPVLGVPISELVDRVVPLSGLWGGAALRLARLLDRADGDIALIREHVETALHDRLRTQPTDVLARGRLVDEAAAALTVRRAGRLPDLARGLAVSERHLRALLVDGAGLPPKRFIRIARLRDALADGSSARLAQLAASAGYFDQSHMALDFRTMLGVSPAAFFAGRLPTPQAC